MLDFEIEIDPFESFHVQNVGHPQMQPFHDCIGGWILYGCGQCFDSITMHHLLKLEFPSSVLTSTGRGHFHDQTASNALAIALYSLLSNLQISGNFEPFSAAVKVNIFS